MSLIAPNVLVGSVEDAFNTSLLHNHQVTTILNVASELHFNERLNMEYFKLGIADDSSTSDMRDILPECLTIIQGQIQKGATVMIHCLEGKSRSICVALAFLVIQHLQYSRTHRVVHQHLDLYSSLLHIINACALHRGAPTIDIFPLYLEQTKVYCQSVKAGLEKPPNPAKMCKTIKNIIN